MIYKQFQGIKLSALGLGAMRLPVMEGDDTKIDVAASEEMLDYAMEQGINYYDTAWGYHGGNSEIVMGKLLAKYPRESYYLASKFPGYDLSNMDKVEEIFEKQLEKCGVGYFDFYLFHNVCEMNIDAYLDKQYGIYDYLIKQKENGRIRHLGFSAHGSHQVIKDFLNNYGSDMEFCMIQLNWLDWSLQQADEKVQLLQQSNIPIWTMEPLRGGRLVKLGGEETKQLKQLRPQESIAGWSFRFIQSIGGTGVCLSGMSNFSQLKENIESFQTEQPLSPKETDILINMGKNMASGIPCTACRYCTSHCPKGLDIPMLLGLYNEHSFSGGGFIAPMALMAVEKDKQPAACIGCKRCEGLCPQNIKISQALKDFAAKL